MLQMSFSPLVVSISYRACRGVQALLSSVVFFYVKQVTCFENNRFINEVRF